MDYLQCLNSVLVCSACVVIAPMHGNKHIIFRGGSSSVLFSTDLWRKWHKFSQITAHGWFLRSFYLEKCQAYSYLFSLRLEKATVGHHEKYTLQSLVVTRRDKPKPTDGCVCVCVYRQQQGEEDVCGREEAAVQWS